MVFDCAWWECTKSFQTAEDREKHFQVHNLNAAGKKCLWRGCKKAEEGTPYGRVSTLKSHVQEQHLHEKLPCTHPGCQKTFFQTQFLLQHRLRDHGIVPNNREIFRCPREGCTEQFVSEGLCTQHVNGRHKDKDVRFYCPFEGCGKDFASPRILQEHVNDKHGDKVVRYACTVEGCSKDFSQVKGLRIHLADAHDTAPWECPVDTCTFSDIDAKILLAHTQEYHHDLQHEPWAMPRRFLHEINPQEKFIFFKEFKRERDEHHELNVTMMSRYDDEDDVDHIEVNIRGPYVTDRTDYSTAIQ